MTETVKEIALARIREAMHVQPDEDEDSAALMIIASVRIRRLEDERDAAWKELRYIRTAIDADEDESTLDEVSRRMAHLIHLDGNLKATYQQIEQQRAAIMGWIKRGNAVVEHCGELEKRAVNDLALIDTLTTACNHAVNVFDAFATSIYAINDPNTLKLAAAQTRDEIRAVLTVKREVKNV